LLALRSFARVRRKRGDVDESGDAAISSCGRNDASAVRVADEDGRATDPPERPFYRSDITFGGIEAVLGGHHLMPLRLKRGHHLAKA